MNDNDLIFQLRIELPKLVSPVNSKTSIESIINTDSFAAKGFIVGIPTLALSILSQAAKLIA